MTNTEISTSGVRPVNMPYKIVVLFGGVVRKTKGITGTYGRVDCEVAFANFMKRGI